MYLHVTIAEIVQYYILVYKCTIHVIILCDVMGYFACFQVVVSLK